MTEGKKPTENQPLAASPQGIARRGRQSARWRDAPLHAVLLALGVLTLLPFAFVVNNSMRTAAEMNHSLFAPPVALADMGRFTLYALTGRGERIEMTVIDPSAESFAGVAPVRMGYAEAMGRSWASLTAGYRQAWRILRPFVLNTLLVAGATAGGVAVLASVSAYVFSRYRFPGHKLLFALVLGFMMIPGVLTLVPSFLLVKELGLINSYWVLILPYVAGGQIFAIFLFKSFFDGLPSELFEAARLDGAGHFRLYWDVVLPLSKPVVSVVVIVNVLGAWNNFLWPFITNSDPKYHVIASGLYLMSHTEAAGPAMFAAYVLSSLPLLVLFVYATRPFIAGVTSGAFKA